MSLISVSVTGTLKGQKCVNTMDSGQVQVRADNELCLRVIGGQESRAPLSNSTNHPSLFLRLKPKTNPDKFCETALLSMSITIFSPFKLDVVQIDQLPKISPNPKSIHILHEDQDEMGTRPDSTRRWALGRAEEGVAQLCSLMC